MQPHCILQYSRNLFVIISLKLTWQEDNSRLFIFEGIGYQFGVKWKLGNGWRECDL